MPLYDYDCAECGHFREWTSLADSNAQIACPLCGAQAERAVAMPFLARMNPHSRIAHARNEKAAHEPMVMTRQELQASGRKRAEIFGDNRSDLNHHGCSHAHHGSEGSGKGLRRAHNSVRPWLIGH